MARRLQKFLLILLVAAAIAAILQVLALCLYAFPHADDFCHMVNLQDLPGVPVYQVAMMIAKDSYLTWNSRWSTMVVHYLVVGSIEPYTQYFIPLIVFGIVRLIALIAFFAAILEMSLSRAVLSAVILDAVLFSSVPELTETTYWLTSVVEYEFTLSCALLLFTLIKLLPPGLLSTALLSVMAMVVAGQNELTGSAIVLILAILFVYQRSNNKKDSIRWLCFLAFAFAGLAAIVFAPGTRIRAATGPLRLHGFVLIRFVLEKLAGTFPRWITEPGVILAAFLWACLTPSMPAPAWLRTRLARWAIPASTALLALMGVVSSPILAGYEPGRALDWSFFVLVIGLLLSITANRDWIAVEFHSIRSLQWVAVLSLACTFYFSPNIELARRGLTKSRSAWRQTMIRRIQLPAGQDVFLPAVELPTPILNSSGVLDDKNHWLNLCVAGYLHVRSILPEPTIDRNRGENEGTAARLLNRTGK
jgi:hypothetical protein